MFTLPVSFKRKGTKYIVSCPILDVYSQGSNKKEALKNIKEALELFFVSCFDRGVLDAVLKESGFQAIEISKNKIPQKRGEERVRIPLPLVASARAAECRA